MADFNLSVIIPTYNRGRLLTRVLELLGHQSCPPDRFDVIVVDDGSSDNTENIMKQLQNKMPYRLDYIKQKKAGPASGRNRAIKKTRADIVLFIGDDTLPKKDLIERHLESHGRCPGSAVLGLVEWGRDQQISDFMRHISPNGFQFRYNTIKDDKD